MKNFIITLVILISAICLSKAQWEPVNNGLYGGNVTCLAVSGNNIFAGTDGSGVFLSTDDGSNWKEINNGLRFLDREVTYLFADSSYLFLETKKTYSSGYFLSTDNGSNWNNLFKKSDLSDFVNAFARINDTLFIGMMTGLYKSTNKGLDWVQNDIWKNVRINAIIVKGSNIYIGTDTNGIFYSSDNGINWVPCNEGLTDKRISALLINDNNLFAGTRNGVYLSKNNGTNWIAVNEGLSNTDVVSFTSSETNIFSRTSNGYIFYTDDKGKNWKLINEGLKNTQIQTFIAKGDKIFAGTKGTGVLSSSDIGSHWLQINNGLINRDIWALTTDNNNILAGDYFGVYKSTDNGMNWKFIGLKDSVIESLVIVNSNIFAGTCGLGGGVFLTNDDGNNWKVVFNALGDDQITYVLALSHIGKYIFAGTNFGIYRISENGNAFEYVYDICCGALDVSSFTVTNNGNNIYAGLDGTGVRLSTNEGMNWDTVSIFPNGVVSLAAIGNNLFAGTWGGGLYLTKDNGLNWIEINNGLTDSYINTLITRGNNIFAGTYSGVFLSTDFGSIWAPINQGMPNFLIRILSMNNDYIYAGTYNYGVYRAKLSDFISDVDEIPIQNELCIYPNPTQDFLYIYNNSNQTGSTSIKVYNMLGDCVYNNVLLNSNNPVKINVKDLLPGLYYIVFKVGNSFERKTFIKN
ncbi:MAG: T9SS type A sorting domain-containing protein [FCB group bacterium]